MNAVSGEEARIAMVVPILLPYYYFEEFSVAYVIYASVLSTKGFWISYV